MRMKYPFAVALLAFTMVIVGCSKSADDAPPATTAAAAPDTGAGKSNQTGAAKAILGPGASSADSRAGSKGKG